MAAQFKTKLMKDKSGHVYFLVALQSTEFNIKDLSARLGLGKKVLLDVQSELRDLFLADPEAESGHALRAPASNDVVALIDTAFETEPLVQGPPGAPESTAMPGSDFYNKTRSYCHSATMVDFGDKRKVGKDNPPDLAEIVASAPVSKAVKQAAEEAASSAARTEADTAAARKSGTASSKTQPSKPPSTPAVVTDVNALTAALIQKVLSLNDVAEGQTPEQRSQARVSVEADVQLELSALKNAAYASGHKAARGAMRALLD